MKRQWMRWIPLAAVAIAALVACGGGTSSTGNNLKGVVTDGAIQGATVFLDLNANQTKDAGEPESGVTAADGSFTIDTSGLTAEQIKAGHLVTIVPDTAKDADDGGKTLAEAGKKSFTLMAPAEAFASEAGAVSGVVVSPLTTLVSHDMQTGNGKSLADAKKAVIARTGLPEGTDLMQDVGKLAKNDKAKTMAQTLAVAIGELQAVLKRAAPTTSDQNALLGTLAHIQTVAAKLQEAVTSATDATLAAKVSSVVANNSSITPDAAALVAEAQKYSSSQLADMMAALPQGLYMMDDACFIQGACSTGTFYVKLLGGSGSYAGQGFNLVTTGGTSTWVGSRTAGFSSELHLTAKGWEKRPDPGYGTYVSDGSAATLTEAGTGLAFRLSARVKDLSGSTWLDFLKLTNVATNSAAYLAAERAGTTQKFPDGSKVYFAFTKEHVDQMFIHPSSPVSDRRGGSPVPLTSIDALINAYQSPASTVGAIVSSQSIFDHGLHFTFDSGGTPTGGTVSLWKSGSIGVVRSGSAKYDIWEPYAGSKILVIRTPNITDSDPNKFPLYAATDGRLYTGSFLPVTAVPEKDSFFNATAIQAIMGFRGLPTTLAR